MKNLLFKLFAFALVLVFANACNDSMISDDEPENIELKSANNAKTSYIVVLQDAEIDSELASLKGYEKKQAAMKSASARILKRAGVIDGEVGHVYGTALKGFSVKIPPGQLKKLENDPAVKYIEIDRVISLGLPKIRINKRPVPTPPAQSTPWGIERVNGGSTYSGSNVAWIVDTGIDTDHPDLNVDVSRSRTFVTTEPIPTVEDLHGHGTHVAGTVAAKNDDIGVVGVAAGATVISCRVLDRSGSGSFSWSVAALDYIAEVGSAGDVVNMSLGPSSRYTDSAVDAAVQAVALLGIKLSIAAGNESDNCFYYSPAHNDGTNIYTISASDINDNWAYFSNYGEPVDFCEPGYSIYSTYKDGGYATMSGTSMAAPHAAGILLLGSISEGGTVSGDPDGDPDPIGVAGGGGNPEPTPNDPPTADFSYTTSGLTVNFSDGSTDSDGTVDSWSWDFGDTNTSTSSSPSHTYPGAGTYEVTLTVTDNDGDSDSSTQSVTVSENTGGGEIALEGVITGNKVFKATLTWTGATGLNVTIYKTDNENNIISTTTVTNSGSYNENLGKSPELPIHYYIIDEANTKSNTIELP